MSMGIAPLAFNIIEYVLEPQDFALFNLTFFRRFGALKNRIIAQAVLLILSFIVAVIGLFIGKEMLVILLNYSVTFFALFLLLFLYTSIIFPYSLKKNSYLVYNSCADFSKPRKMEFFDEVLRVSKRFTRDTYSWNDLHGCLETTTCFFFYFDEDEPVGEILPKSTLTQQQVEKISAFLKERLSVKYMIY